MTCVPDLKVFYSNSGVMPCHLSANQPFWYYLMRLHGLNGSVEYQAFLIAIAILLAVLLFFDRAPRLMMVGSWFLFMSLCDRNRLVLNGGDVYLRLLLFWGMFLPIPKSNKKVCSISTAAILLQIGMVYFFTALFKSSPVWWPEGLAVYNVLQLKNFTTQLGSWLGGLPMPVLRALTYLVYFMEWLAPILLFSPYKTRYFRLAGVTALTLMHLAFGVCLFLGSFSGVCIVATALFIPKEFWDRIGFFLHEKSPIAESAKSVFSSALKFGVNIFLIVSLFFALAFNLNHVPRFKNRLPAALLNRARSLGLRQEWNMFAPYPLTICIWYIVEGHLANGQIVDLLRTGKPLDISEPKNYREIYPNRHWHAYMRCILNETKDRQELARRFTDYLAREWNKTHKNSERVLRIRLYKAIKCSAKSPKQGMTYFTREVDTNY